jgi:miniconductance mechanosensitive channel
MVFLFDTGWFHILSESEIERIENEHNFKLFLDKEELKDGIINAKVYRLYLYHWLMGHEHISQQPRLMVRWMEQKECGMPLQVNAFILETGLDPFDWQQSMIVEHIMTSASWFGMRLYQSPSGYDVGHGDIHLTDRSATYKMDEMG